jgi:hypothetical protein
MTKHIINPKNLALIVKELIYRLPQSDIKELFQSLGIIKDFTAYKGTTLTEAVTEALNILSASEDKASHKLLLQAIEEMLNQLMCRLGSKDFKKVEHEIRTMLFHDELFLYKNKVYRTNDHNGDELIPENMFLHFLIEEQQKSVSSLELYLKKKILTEANWIDDIPYEPFMLSFNNNTLTQVVDVIEDLENADLIHISVNTGDDFRTKGHIINWELIKEIDNNPEKIKKVHLGIDTEVFKDWTDEDEDGNEVEIFPEEELQKEINEAITKFIYEERKATEEAKEIWKYCGSYDENNEAKYIKQQEGKSDFGIAHNFYSYRKQKEIVITQIIELYEKYGTEQVVLSFDMIQDLEVDVLKTVCALEFEGLIEILQLGNHKVEWADKDDIFARLIADVSKLTEVLNKPEPKIEIADPNKTEKVFLKDIGISFNPDNGKGDGELTLGTKMVLLSSDTKQYGVCKFMYKNEPKKYYSWDEIYCDVENIEATSSIPDEMQKQKKTIINAVSGITKKVQLALNTDDELFTYKNKGVTRNY